MLVSEFSHNLSLSVFTQFKFRHSLSFLVPSLFEFLVSTVTTVTK